MAEPVQNPVLVGYPVSNYVNIVRAALLEKDIEHGFEPRGASQDAQFLAANPMGKIPYLATATGTIAETVAILEYLDDVYPATALRPDDAMKRARMRQIINIIQVYVEVPARGLYPAVFANAQTDTERAQEIKSQIERGSNALRKLVEPAPFLMGAAPTAADLFAYYNFGMAERVYRSVFDESFIGALGLGEWQAVIVGRDSTRKVMADFETSLQTYIKDKGSDYRFEPEFLETSHA